MMAVNPLCCIVAVETQNFASLLQPMKLYFCDDAVVNCDGRGCLRNS